MKLHSIEYNLKYNRFSHINIDSVVDNLCSKIKHRINVKLENISEIVLYRKEKL